jgi:DNA-directed RNA polymerase specialized sigma24 family protein
MATYLRVCPDCGDERVYANSKPSHRPKEGTRCQRCSAKAARRKIPASYGPTFAQLTAPPPPPRPPGEDVDWVVVERLTKGVLVQSNRDEQREAIRILDGRGLPTEEISKLVHIDRKTVKRLR